MSHDAQKQNAMVSRLILDMKAVALLNPSDVDLRYLVRGQVMTSQDDQVKRFMDSMTAGRPQGRGNSVLIVAGELLLASFLLIGGVAMIAPVLVGGTTPASLIQYFSSSLRGIATSPQFLPILPELVVLLAILLLMSALYTLRRASKTLRDEGLVSR